jgi:hypothetical protein
MSDDMLVEQCGRLQGPRWLKHLGAPYLRLGRRCLDFTSSVSRLFALGLRAPESRDDFELSAVQLSGLPGNDRPVTHTVTSHLARSSILARWIHSISSEMRPPRSLPLAGSRCSTRNIDPPENIPIDALVEE